MNTSEKLCLNWNDFKENVSYAFGDLRKDNDLLDVTLACEDGQMEAHKVVLASLSPSSRISLRRTNMLTR